MRQTKDPARIKHVCEQTPSGAGRGRERREEGRGEKKGGMRAGSGAKTTEEPVAAGVESRMKTTDGWAEGRAADRLNVCVSLTVNVQSLQPLTPKYSAINVRPPCLYGQWECPRRVEYVKQRFFFFFFFSPHVSCLAF